MTKTQYRVFREASDTLRKLHENTHNVLFVHYSCESFYDRPGGTSPRITSIAVRFMGSGQTRSFSIHQQAELEGTESEAISREYDQLELRMLANFYEFVRKYSACQWVHWNMRDGNYGFEAIAHRYRVLGGEPVEIVDANKIDLARLMHDFLGKEYIKHPRLYHLLERNQMVPRNILSGKEEAEAFEKCEYFRLHQSTLSKVDAFMDLVNAAMKDELRCNNNYFKRRGLTISTLALAIKDHPMYSALTLAAALVGIVLTAISNFK